MAEMTDAELSSRPMETILPPINFLARRQVILQRRALQEIYRQMAFWQKAWGPRD